MEDGVFHFASTTVGKKFPATQLHQKHFGWEESFHCFQIRHERCYSLALFIMTEIGICWHASGCSAMEKDLIFPPLHSMNMLISTAPMLMTHTCNIPVGTSSQKHCGALGSLGQFPALFQEQKQCFLQRRTLAAHSRTKKHKKNVKLLTLVLKRKPQRNFPPKPPNQKDQLQLLQKLIKLISLWHLLHQPNKNATSVLVRIVKQKLCIVKVNRQGGQHIVTGINLSPQL